VTDHAVLVPTTLGPVGAIVSEPAGRPRAALILLQGDGRPCRSGIDAVWTHFARDLAAQGVLVLRFDYVGQGEGTMIPKDALTVQHKGDIDIVLLREVATWFRERSGLTDLLVAGDCHGGRLAIVFAGGDRHVVGAFLSVPYLKKKFVDLETRRKPVGRVRLLLGKVDAGDFHEDVLKAVPLMLRQGPVWLMAGEKDGDEAFQLKRVLGRKARGLEIEVVPGMAVHPVASRGVREEVVGRLRHRIMQAVATPVESGSNG
jgi:hypothetical protein